MKKTLLESFIVALTVVGALILFSMLIYGFSKPTPDPAVCVSLPKTVALWGVNVHDTSAGLFLCFQQGVGEETTETKCVPMTKEKCSK